MMKNTWFLFLFFNAFTLYAQIGFQGENFLEIEKLKEQLQECAVVNSKGVLTLDACDEVAESWVTYMATWHEWYVKEESKEYSLPASVLMEDAKFFASLLKKLSFSETSYKAIKKIKPDSKIEKFNQEIDKLILTKNNSSVFRFLETLLFHKNKIQNPRDKVFVNYYITMIYVFYCYFNEIDFEGYSLAIKEGIIKDIQLVADNVYSAKSVFLVEQYLFEGGEKPEEYLLYDIRSKLKKISDQLEKCFLKGMDREKNKKQCDLVAQSWVKYMEENSSWYLANEKDSEGTIDEHIILLTKSLRTNSLPFVKKSTFEKMKKITLEELEQEKVRVMVGKLEVTKANDQVGDFFSSLLKYKNQVSDKEVKEFVHFYISKLYWEYATSYTNQFIHAGVIKQTVVLTLAKIVALMKEVITYQGLEKAHKEIF